MPPEKKKKGKRKSDAVLEMVESDDTASLSTLATGGEESTDPMDNTVSSPEPIFIRPPGFKFHHSIIFKRNKNYKRKKTWFE